MNQQAFAASLLDPSLPGPSGLTSWNGSDPRQRFGVYRNNVIVSLTDALSDAFPVSRELVGDEFFRAMARAYIQVSPPRTRLMAFYGSGFPAFIETFAPAAPVPYLADVARLEYRRIVAYHAADVAPVSIDSVNDAIADQASLPQLRLMLHPSVSVVESRWAVVSLWAAHQGALDLSTVLPTVAEAALILRHDLEVEVLKISDAAAAFVRELGAGAQFGDAATRAANIDDDFDLAGILSLLLQKYAITALAH